MFGKRFLQDSVPNSPHLPAVPVIQQQPDSIKYEFDQYAMHHPGMTNNLDIGNINKHQSQQHPLSQQGDVKYSCSLDFARQNRALHDLVSHNHTYTLPQGTGATPRPQARDKKVAKKIEEEHLTRDEKRARALSVCTTILYYAFFFKLFFFYGMVTNNFFPSRIQADPDASG